MQRQNLNATATRATAMIEIPLPATAKAVMLVVLAAPQLLLEVVEGEQHVAMNEGRLLDVLSK